MANHRSPKLKNEGPFNFLLFESMSAVDSYNILKNSDDKKWLLRESREQGMITIDYSDPSRSPHRFNSKRLCLINNNWTILNSERPPHTPSKTITKVDKSNIHEHWTTLYEFIMENILNDFNYNQYDGLAPKLAMTPPVTPSATPAQTPARISTVSRRLGWPANSSSLKRHREPESGSSFPEPNRPESETKTAPVSSRRRFTFLNAENKVCTPPKTPEGTPNTTPTTTPNPTPTSKR